MHVYKREMKWLMLFYRPRKREIFLEEKSLNGFKLINEMENQTFPLLL